jgi:hypothetical protein
MPAKQKPKKLVPNKKLRRFIESKPCVICKKDQRSGTMAAHHLKTRGAGGKDEYNLVPVHWFGCHTIAHTKSVDKLSAELGIDLREYAKELTEEFNSL